MNLTPYSSLTLNFIFDTSAVTLGNYTITAFIPYLTKEADYSDNLLVDGIIEVRAARQYYLTVRTDPLDVTIIAGEGWYDEESNATLNAPEYVSIATGARYKFSYWDIDGTPDSTNLITVTMNTNHTVTAHFVLQYYLTVVSLYGSIGGEGWYNAYTTAYATLNLGTIDHGNNTRRVFVNWGGDASGTHFMQSNDILMDRPKTAVANWKTQYYLTVRVDPSGIVAIPGEGWYNEMENVALTALSVEGYDFGHWDVDGTSKGDGVNAITILMNNPHTATAHYTTQVRGWYVPWWSLFWFLLLPLLLILALIIALLYRRRKKKKTEETFYRGWTAWYYQYNLRNRTHKI